MKSGKKLEKKSKKTLKKKKLSSKINTIILGNLSSKVNRLTKKEQDPAEPCRFRQDLGIVIGAVWWPP